MQPLAMRKCGSRSACSTPRARARRSRRASLSWRKQGSVSSRAALARKASNSWSARRQPSLRAGVEVLMARANGKVILLGEHAVVYGVPAIAAGIERGVEANAVPAPSPELRVGERCAVPGDGTDLG